MTDDGRLRERRGWIAVTAALAIALTWLASLTLVLLLQACGEHCPEVAVVLRALALAAWQLGRVGAPAVLAALAATGLLLALALRSGARTEGRRHHA